MKIGSLFGWVCLALSASAIAQETLTNDSIEKMAMARLGDDVIVAMIQNQAGHYDVTPETLISLKREGISNKVLAALAAKGSTSAMTPTAPATAPATAQPAVVADPYEDLDIGVYRKLRQTWTLVASEEVNWKTGGVVKSLVTDGIIKKDVNGRLIGGSSVVRHTDRCLLRVA